MPRQELLTPAQRMQFLALPNDPKELAGFCALSQEDLALIATHRGDENRLGFGFQLCLLRHSGRAWDPEEQIPQSVIQLIATQLNVDAESFQDYSRRDRTRREHLNELYRAFSWKPFGIREYREFSGWLKDVARTTDNGVALIRALMAQLKQRRIVMPVLTVLDRLASAVRLRARREAFRALTDGLTEEQQRTLDGLLAQRPESWQTSVSWIRQPPGAASAGNILKCIERLSFVRKIGIPTEWARRIHQNRLLQIAREGFNTDAAHLKEFIEERRRGTLVAMLLEAEATLTDQTLELHERFLGREFRRAERKHDEAF